MPLQIKTLSEQILFATLQETVVCSQLEFNLLLSSDTSILTLILVKLLYLTKYYFITSTTHIFKINLKINQESMLATKIKHKRMLCGQRALQR